MLDYQHIKKLAADAGFDLCGLAPCGHMAQNEAWLRAWLGKGYQSSLTYMERNVEKRADPRKLVEGARTAVVCAVSYKNRIGEGYPPGLDRPPVAARHAPPRHLCPAGRAAPDRRSRRLRRPVRGFPLRPLPQLHRELSHGRHRRPEGDRHGPLHLVPHHRTGAVRRNRPRRLDFRLRPLPELLSPQPEGADARQSGVRSRLRPADDGCRSMDGVGRNGVRSPHGRNAPDPQRSGAHPRQYQNRISAFAPTA